MVVDIVTLYSIGLGAPIILLCLVNVTGLRLGDGRWRQRPLVRTLLRTLAYRNLHRSIPITILEIAAFTAYVGASIFCNLYKANDKSSRAAWLSVANLVPLFISGRAAIIGKVLNLSLREVALMHRLTGLVAVGEMITHFALEVRHPKDVLQGLVRRTGLGVIDFIPGRDVVLISQQALILAGVLIMLLLSCRAHYEFFRRSHLMLAVLFALTVYAHPSPRRPQGLVYLVLSVGSLVLLLSTQLVTILFRNSILRRHSTRAEIVPRGDALEISLDALPKVRPGQWVYVWMPAVDFWSIFQSHPFMVIWQSDERQTESPTVLLAQPHRSFTYKLKHQISMRHSYLTWVDGPYGSTPEYTDFDNVLFVASGMGVASHLLAIKALVKGYHERTVRAKCITVYWDMEHSGTVIMCGRNNLTQTRQPRLGT